jgi:hypothetical protein
MTFDIPEDALRLARMIEENERVSRQFDIVRRLIEPSAAEQATARMIEEVERLDRQSDSLRQLLDPSPGKRAIQDLMARDAALSQRFAADAALSKPIGLGSAAETAILGIEKGAVLRSFEVRPEWIPGFLGLSDQMRKSVLDAQGILPPVVSGMLKASSDVARLFASTDAVGRVIHDMERGWKDLVAPAQEAVTAWNDLTRLAASAEATWATFARLPDRLALVTPELAQAPGIELYLAARASSLVIDLPDSPSDELGGELESEVEIITDGFETRLAAFDPQLLTIYKGAVERIERRGTDWARHALISFREVVMHTLHILAPDAALTPWAQTRHYHNGKLTRHARLEFIFRDVDEGDFAEFMKMDYKTAIGLFDLLNKVHKKELTLTEAQFRVLRNRIQGFLNTLLEAAGN